MKKFNVGEKVVALTNSPGNMYQPREKGKVYTVLAVGYCSGCGVQRINVAGKNKAGITKCNCGHEQPNNGLWWTKSQFFSRPCELQAELELAEQEERYEDCADLVGIMAELEINKENVNQ